VPQLRQLDGMLLIVPAEPKKRGGVLLHLKGFQIYADSSE
jgi:hypothetical protein